MRTRTVFYLSLLLIIVVVAFGACASTQVEPQLASSTVWAEATMIAQEQVSRGYMAQDGAVDALLMTQVPAGAEAQQQGEQPVTGRVILRSVSLRLIVTDPDAAMAQVTTLTNEYGGWVVNSSSNRVALASGGETTRATIRVRVPAERLDEALAQFKEGVIKVDAETVTGDDVTQDYVDVSSRLSNLEAAESQLRQIMEDAVRTQDVLDVYNELVRTRGEIEVLRGRLNYYDEAAAFSLVTVELVPEAIQQPIQIAGWSPGRTVENAVASLLNVLQGLADFVIRFVIVGLPLLLIAVVVIWMILRIGRRFIRRPRRLLSAEDTQSTT